MSAALTQSPAPAMSLVVATLNRPSELSRLVASLAEQEVGPLQLIVVDQSDAAAAQLNAAMLSRQSGAIEVVHLKQEGRGLSRARNLGLRQVRGGILCFPDDDCWYPPYLLARVKAWFAAHSGYDFVSGRYVDPDSPAPRAHDPEAIDLTAWNSFLRVASVTLFFRRQTIVEERFDERIGAGCELPVGEEIDLVLRLLRSGRRGRYEPSIVVHHPVVPFDRANGSAFHQHERAYGYVLAKHALTGSVPVAARLMLGLGKAAGNAIWSREARASLAGRFGGVAMALADGPRE